MRLIENESSEKFSKSIKDTEPDKNRSQISSQRPEQFENDDNYNALQMMEKIDLNHKIDEMESGHFELQDIGNLNEDEKKQEDLDSILNKYSLSNELIIIKDIQSTERNPRQQSVAENTDFANSLPESPDVVRDEARNQLQLQQ